MAWASLGRSFCQGLATIGLTAALAISPLLSTPARASDWPSSGNSDVSEGEDYCAINGNFLFDDRPEVSFSLLQSEDGILIAFSSLGWSALPDAEAMTYSFGGAGTFTGPASPVPEVPGNGFLTLFELEVLDAFASGESLLVTRGETVVTHINLRGSAAATQTLRRCTAAVNRRLAAKRAEEERFAYIPADPFGSSIPRPSGPVRPPVITNPTWARHPSPTYPDRALERGISGSADLSCQVQANGSVTGCSVVSETPSGAGFGRAAVAAARSARLSPRSVAGVATGGQVLFTVRFNLPPPPAESHTNPETGDLGIDPTL